MFDSRADLIIGIDGGGSGCRVAVGTVADGVVATAQGGAANVASNFESTIANLCCALTEAIEAAGLTTSDLGRSVAHAGLAGVMSQTDGANVAARLPIRDCEVSDDRPTALAGALGAADGALLAVGTGIVAIKRDADQIRSVGGWGFQLADQGSGAWLGRAALEQVLLCHDGMARHSDLTRTLLDTFDTDPNKIVAFSLAATPGDYARFAPEIIAAADSGDPNGQGLMAAGAKHLLRYLQGLEAPPGTPLCLTGGIGPHYAAYLPRDVLQGRMAPLGNALDGAFHLARTRASERAG